MPPLALVTGSRPSVEAAAATLARTGFDVVAWETSTAPPAPGDQFDCYVQLPCSASAPPADPVVSTGADPAVPTGADPAVSTGGSAADELICRIDTLAAVATRLRPDASVLLGVADPDPGAAPESAKLAPDLLAAMALALLEDLDRPSARVAVLPAADLCRTVPASDRIDRVVDLTQWEMPTPPRVSAP